MRKAKHAEFSFFDFFKHFSTNSNSTFILLSRHFRVIEFPRIPEPRFASTFKFTRHISDKFVNRWFSPIWSFREKYPPNKFAFMQILSDRKFGRFFFSFNKAVLSRWSSSSLVWKFISLFGNFKTGVLNLFFSWRLKG